MRKRPDDWRADARNALTVRNIQPAHKRLLGDSEFAAQLLPLAQTVLGGLRSHLALGGISQGARKVTLEDGSLIRVVCNGDLQIIEIDRRAAEGRMQAFFIVHPHADSAPNGWWWPTSETTARAVMAGYYYPKHSYYSLAGVNTNFWWKAWNRPNAMLVANPTGCVLIRDQDLWCGNQAVTSPDGTVWSWWHSPHGDAPLYVQAGGEILYRAWHTPYGVSPLQVTVYYDSPTWKTAVLTPCVFRDSTLVWSYSDSDLSNEINAITSDDQALIGGVYPVTASRILVVVLTNAARTATLWDVHLSPPSGSTKTSVWTATVGTANTAAMRWPWRFKPDGTECSTIVAYTLDSPAGGGVKYTEYKIWTLTISYNEGTDAFSASKSEGEADYLQYQYESSRSWDGGYGPGTYSSSHSGSGEIVADHARIPLALAYDAKGIRQIAWVDYTDSAIASSGSSTLVIEAGTGDMSKNGASSGTSTEIRTLTIGGWSYPLRAVSYSTNSEESRYAGASASWSQESSVTDTGIRRRVLYLDVATKTVLAYSDHSTVNYSLSESAEWPGGSGSLVMSTVGGSTTYTKGNHLWYGETRLVDEPVELAIAPEPRLVGFPYIDNPPSWSGSESGTTDSYELTPDQSALSFDLGFGMAIDQNGFFLFSYEIKARDASMGGTLIPLDRKTGAHSNIPGFQAALAFGENPLLFPLGLGRRATAG